jgi:hypothetical protein
MPTLLYEINNNIIDNKFRNNYIVYYNFEEYQLPIFYFKCHFWKSGFRLGLQKKPTHVGPIDRASLCFRTERDLKTETESIIRKAEF